MMSIGMKWAQDVSKLPSWWSRCRYIFANVLGRTMVETKATVPQTYSLLESSLPLINLVYFFSPETTSSNDASKKRPCPLQLSSLRFVIFYSGYYILNDLAPGNRLPYWTRKNNDLWCHPNYRPRKRPHWWRIHYQDSRHLHWSVS
jgi:hypothetical protein